MWEKYKLSDIGTIVGGATPSTTVDKYYGGDIPWLTPKDLSSFNDRYITRGERNITEDGLKSCSAQLLPKGSVLFSSRAPIGYVAIANNPIATNQGFKSIIPNKNTNSLFLYYLLKYNKANIEAMGSGTTFKEVSGTTMKNIEVLLPPLVEQERIAGILGALDDKIECNNRINRNLEQQAAALFRRWFVDFEFPNPDPTSPTYGKPYRSSGGKMQDSPLGEIPTGWEVKPLEDIIAYQEGPGIRNWQYVNENGVKFINIRCIQNNDLSIETANMISEEEASGKYAHFMLKPWDIVMSTSGTLGRYAIIREEHLPLCLNTSVIRFVPKHNNSYAFVFCYLSSQEFYEHLLTKASGSVQANFGPMHLRQIEILHANKHIISNFDSIVMPIINRIQKNKKENKTLATLRDSLLPQTDQ